MHCKSITDLQNQYDIIIIGTGAGGSTLAYSLQDSNKDILIVERGDFLPQEPENSSPLDVFKKMRYSYPDNWRNQFDGKSIDNRGSIYYVGGKSKLYGSALMRMRTENFSGVEHFNGTTPTWPISYKDLEPYYSAAEMLYEVHGKLDKGASEPFHSADYPFHEIPLDKYSLSVKDYLQSKGTNPTVVPIGMKNSLKSQEWKFFDGYPSYSLLKAEADVICIRPLLSKSNITLSTNTFANKLVCHRNNEIIESVELHQGPNIRKINAKIFIVSCGAIHSPALFLRSRNEKQPEGLANSSNLIGKNLLLHNTSSIIAMHPFRINDCIFQKRFNILDYYSNGGDDWPLPLGMIQSLGHMPLGCFLPTYFRWLGKIISKRSSQFFATSEDLPSLENTVSLDNDGNIRIHYKPNNMETHRKLVHKAKKILRGKMFPIVFSVEGNLTLCHACGTMRFGNSPKNSVLNQFCRTHDLKNVYCVDASFFPSAGAVNPALTIMAQALRVGSFLMKVLPKI